MFKTIQQRSGTTPPLFTPLSSLHNYHTRNSSTNFFFKTNNTELGKNLKKFLGKSMVGGITPYQKKNVFIVRQNILTISNLEI